MAKKEALRELQSRLADRLQAARTQDRGRSWLAVECAGHGFLFPLQEAGEIFPYAPPVPVPYTNRWFMGVANLRGGLHGVVDLAGFLGVRSASSVRENAWLVAFNSTLDINCAVLVDQLAGLRSADQLTPEPPDGQALPPFVGTPYRDRNQRLWRELNLSALAHDTAFLKIAG
jgi:twitching motility protein PilI